MSLFECLLCSFCSIENKKRNHRYCFVIIHCGWAGYVLSAHKKENKKYSGRKYCTTGFNFIFIDYKDLAVALY